MKTNHKHLNDPAFFFMASVSPPTLATNGHRIRIDFAPSADEVARKVYLNYGTQEALPGQELHHWLEAEAQLLTERIVTLATASPTGR